MMNWRQYQAMQKIFEMDGRFLSYVDQGKGEPLVFLHGLPTWGYLWSGMLQEFSKTYRVLIPDLLGFGYSDKSDRMDRSIARQAEVVVAWLRKLGISSANIVGHDIGGGVALRLVTLFSGMVRRLCVMNTVCYDSWPVELMLQLGYPGLNQRLSAKTLLAILRRGVRRGFQELPADELVESLVVPYSTDVGKLSLIRNASSLNTNHTMEISPLLLKVLAPALIIWGEEDRSHSVQYGRLLATDIPHAEFFPVRGARYFVMLEKHRLVSDRLSAFLRETEVSAGLAA